MTFLVSIITTPRRKSLNSLVREISLGACAVLVLVGSSGCGGTQESSNAKDRPTEFDCATVDTNLDPMREAMGKDTPAAAAADYLPDGAEVVSKPTDLSKATRQVTFYAYDDGDLVAQVEVHQLMAGHGWWTLAARRCT